MKNVPISNNSSNPGTIVGSNVALTGTLKDNDDIAVYGVVEGEVISENTVTVGHTAQVKGPVRAKFVSIAGTVYGSIDASDKLEILDTGKVYGSIATKDLVIHSGAVFVGESTMQNGDVASVETAPTPKTDDVPSEKTDLKSEEDLPQPDAE